MTNIETLKALVDAGDKATIGYWGAYLSDSAMSFSISSGSKKIAVLRKSKYLNNAHCDAQFITQAANSRDALKAVLDELGRLRKLDTRSDPNTITLTREELENNETS